MFMIDLSSARKIAVRPRFHATSGIRLNRCISLSMELLVSSVVIDSVSKARSRRKIAVRPRFHATSGIRLNRCISLSMELLVSSVVIDSVSKARSSDVVSKN